MKKIFLLIILAVVLTGCSSQGKSLVSHDFKIPKGHQVEVHSSELIEFSLNGKPSGEYKVISFDDYEKEMATYKEPTVILDVKDVLYPAKQVFIQKGSDIGGVKYFLLDNEQKVVHTFYFKNPEFAPENTLSYVKTFKRLE